MRTWEQQKQWNSLEQRTQNENGKAALKQCCQLLGLQDDVELLSVDENDRFKLRYEQDPTKKHFASNMIKLEKLMRQVLGVVVDLRLEPMKDKNNRAGRNGRE
jgi:hypothetical protein